MADAGSKYLLLQFILPIFAGLTFCFLSHRISRAAVLLLAMQCILLVVTETETFLALFLFVPLVGMLIRTLQTNGRAWLPFAAVFFLLWFLTKYGNAFGITLASLGGSDPEQVQFIQELQLVGISYLGFKLIHFLIDVRSGTLQCFRVSEVLAWLFFVPSMVAGPMQRFQDWQSQRESARLSVEHLAIGTRRILFGSFLKLVLANSIGGATLSSMTASELNFATPLQIAAASALYTVYLFFDFAGYSSIAIGLGHFWGITLPENFNAPYRARNLAEFWKRWHISLSELLRDYLFYPLSLKVKRIAWFRSHGRLAAAIPPLVTFVTIGLWHGASWGFLIFGTLHGAGLAFLAVLGRGKRKDSPLRRWWRESAPARMTAMALTFAYVTFTFIFFCLSNEKLLLLLHRMS